MSERGAGWLEIVRSLGEALLEVLRAELRALGSDIGASGRGLGIALVLLGVAAGLLFWTLGVLTLAAIEILALWLPRWGATLVLSGLLLIVVALLVGLGWLRLRRLESPAATVRRRVSEHLEWWHSGVLGPGTSQVDEAAGRLTSKDDG